MIRKILTVIGTGIGLILAIDWLGRRLTGHWLLDIIVRKIGIQGGIRAVPIWIRFIIVVILMFLMIKYDKFVLSPLRSAFRKGIKQNKKNR